MVRNFQRSLLEWYGRQRRDLPWRRTRDPWSILVSEVMLQQTRVDVVIPYYERFLRRFPDPAAFARADEAAVLEVWSGLGYYRRARLLQRAAQTLVERHGGRFPEDYEALLGLPGLGRYTAGALASIAFDLPHPVVDGNVARVFTRLFRIAGDPRSPATSKRLWQLADELLDRERAGDFNQALMELGALVCLPVRPRCLLCPLAERCEARNAQDVERFPERGARRAAVDVRLAVVIVREGDGVGLVRRAPGHLMEGLLDLPAIELLPDADARPRLRRHLRERYGVEVRGLEPVGEARHTVTHRRIRVEVHEAFLAGRATASLLRESADDESAHGIAPHADGRGLTFHPCATLADLGLSALARKSLKVAEAD